MKSRLLGVDLERPLRMREMDEQWFIQFRVLPITFAIINPTTIGWRARSMAE